MLKVEENASNKILEAEKQMDKKMTQEGQDKRTLSRLGKS